MKALVVDDDRVLADVVAFTLRREGFDVVQADDGASALRCWEETQPDIILLDVNMPRMDGFTVCQHIRRVSDVPIILLTVRGEEDDIVRGLEIGADDYVVKPFSPRQLVARARTILRRAGKRISMPVIQVDDFRFDRNLRQVSIAGHPPVPLTHLESRLLECLMVNAGQVLNNNTIIDHVWGPTGGDRDMLRQLVHRLRGKVEVDPANPVVISTIPGLGYGFMVS